MTHEEKINNFLTAAAIVGFTFKGVDADKLISVYELIIDKGDQTSLKDVTKVEVAAEKRAEKKELEK